MNTIKLYQQDVNLKEAMATVTAVDCRADSLIISTDRTIFFPGGGGQPCDLGEINGYPLMEVYEGKADSGEIQIYHRIKLGESDLKSEAKQGSIAANAGEQSSANSIFHVGREVSMKLDWDRRFDNMQRHCGEHILSGMFYREFGGINRGFHMGDEYMTIDISLEEDPDYPQITWEMARHAEYCANQAIWANVPVTTRYFTTAEEAEGLPMRKKLALDEDFTIVCVGDESRASDCVACCGTHPTTAGQVGLIKIWKVESYKGMFRIYCEAGSRAFKDYQEKHEIISYLGGRYSAGPEDLTEKIAAAEKKAGAVRNELYKLKQQVIKEKVAELEVEISKSKAQNRSESEDRYGTQTRAGTQNRSGNQPQKRTQSGPAEKNQSEVIKGEAQGKTTKSTLIIKEYEILSVDDLLQIGKPFVGQDDKSKQAGKSGQAQAEKAALGDKLLALIAAEENTVVLFSDGKHYDCGKLVKENAPIYRGKGGGTSAQARALFPDRECLDTYLDLIEKHLR